MKPFRVIALGLILACAMQVNGNAQGVFYTWPSFSLGNDGASDSIIRETRKGDEILDAEIDFCFQRELYGKWDRIVLPLKAEGGKLSGVGTSQIAKIPVVVDLTKKRVKQTFSYSGAIRIGEVTSEVAQDYIVDQRREEITDPQDHIALVENPADFTAVQPNTIAVRFKRGELKNVLAALRGEPLVLDTNYGLIEDCSALRTDRQTMQFTTPPENAVSVVAKLRKLNGVLAAGWSGYSSYEQAVRISGAEWNAQGKLDRDKLVAALEKSVARALAAKFLSSRWEPNTGQLVLELERPSKRFQDAGFSESVTVRVLVSPERFGSAEFFIVWVPNATANLLDSVSGPRLDIPPFHEVGGEGYVAPDPIVAAIAKDLRGATWDSGTEKWKPLQ